MAPPLPELMEELTEEILLRFPPANPASLVRAGLVCKLWRRLISSAAFRRRFLEFHRIASTDEPHELPALPYYLPEYSSHKWNAAVACTAAACPHLDCHRGPFLVVLIAVTSHYMYVHVYSFDEGVAAAWTITVSERPVHDFSSTFEPARGVLAQNAFYFLVHFNDEIVGYDMASRKVSVVRLPYRFRRLKRSIVLMTDDGGGLGFVACVKDKLELWSRVVATDGGADFVLTRVIDLQKVLCLGTLIKNSTQVNGFADGGGRRVLFIRMLDDLYTIEINSRQVRKLDNYCGDDKNVVPYISFFTPTSNLQPPGSSIRGRAPLMKGQVPMLLINERLKQRLLSVSLGRS